MAEIDDALAENRKAVQALIAAAEASGSAWATPRAPKKWSPSQVVEHVAMSLEDSAKLMNGESTRFPSVPRFLRPLFRGLFFNRVVRQRTFFKAKTNAAMDPATGPALATDARGRLEGATQTFEAASRVRAAADGLVHNSSFGDVPVTDYAIFMAMHTRHHCKQMPGGGG